MFSFLPVILLILAAALMLTQNQDKFLAMRYRLMVLILLLELLMLENYQAFGEVREAVDIFVLLNNSLGWIKFLVYAIYLMDLFAIKWRQIFPTIILFLAAVASIVLSIIQFETGSELIGQIASGIYVATFSGAGLVLIVLVLSRKLYVGAPVFSAFLLVLTVARSLTSSVFYMNQYLLKELLAVNSLVFMGGLVGHYWWLRHRHRSTVTADAAPDDSPGANGPEPVPGLVLLSFRERELVRMAAQGKSYKEIAGELNISLNTVKHHLSSAYHKLGVRNRGELLLKFPESL